MDIRNNQGAKLSLPSDREILIVRDFNAPKSLLFEVWTKPEHVQQWYPCHSLRLPICEIDLREGGKWRWVMQDIADGSQHPMSGEYREIAAPDRLVFTERYEPVPGSEHLVTLTFEERDGKTTFTSHMRYPSKEARDGHLQSGMESGLEATHERLDAVIASLLARK